MGIFHSFLYVYQRVWLIFHGILWDLSNRNGDSIRSHGMSHQNHWVVSTPLKRMRPSARGSSYGWSQREQNFKHRRVSCWWCNFTIWKNDGVRQWEGWHPIYEMENKIHVWNHQPIFVCFGQISRGTIVFFWSTEIEGPSHQTGLPARIGILMVATKRTSFFLDSQGQNIIMKINIGNQPWCSCLSLQSIYSNRFDLLFEPVPAA